MKTLFLLLLTLPAFSQVVASIDGTVATLRFESPRVYTEPPDLVGGFVRDLQIKLGLPVEKIPYTIEWKRPEGWNRDGEPWYSNPNGLAVHEEVATIWSGPPERGVLVRTVVELPYGVNECTQKHAAMHMVATSQGYVSGDHPAFVYAVDGTQYLVADLLGRRDCWCPGVCTIDPRLQYDFRPAAATEVRAARALTYMGVMHETTTRASCPARTH